MSRPNHVGSSLDGLLNKEGHLEIARYGAQIQQVLRDERSTADPAAGDIDIDQADVPF